MFSKRILHVASALSMSVLGIKNGIPDQRKLNNKGNKIDNHKLSLFPGFLSPKVSALFQGINTFADQGRDREFATAVDRARKNHQVSLFSRHPSHMIIELPEFYQYYNFKTSRPVFNVQRFTSTNELPEDERVLLKRELPADFYPTIPLFIPDRLWERDIENPEYHKEASKQFLEEWNPKVYTKRHNDVKNYVKELVNREGGEAIVITGPMYVHDDRFLAFTKGFRRAQWDEKGLQIPTHYYYLVIINGNNGYSSLYSIVTPNFPIDGEENESDNLAQRMARFHCPLGVIKHYTLTNFFPNGTGSFQSIHERPYTPCQMTNVPRQPRLQRALDGNYW